MGQQLKGIRICETDDSVAIVYELLKIQEFQTYITGVGKCRMTWEYWTSPKIVAI